MSGIDENTMNTCTEGGVGFGRCFGDCMMHFRVTLSNLCRNPTYRNLLRVMKRPKMESSMGFVVEMVGLQELHAPAIHAQDNQTG